MIDTARCATARRHSGAARVALAALILIGLTACEKKAASETAPDGGAAPELAQMTIALETARREQTWDGVIEAVNEATMSAQTTGRVLELPYDVNDFVPAGALVVRLTDVEQQAAVRQAKANAEEAQSHYERVQQLYEKKVAAKATLDQARTQHEAAQAALRTAERQLEYTVGKAPYAGYVTKRFVRVGEEVQPGQPMIGGISLDALRVAVEIPQSAADAIRKFKAADVLLDAASDTRIGATAITIFPYADPQTHSFTVRVTLPQETPDLYPGMTVKVLFQIGEAERLLVPHDALVQRAEFSGIYVIAGNEVPLRQLRLGHRFGDKVEALAGLDPGETIATDPAAAAAYVAARQKKAAP